MRIRSAWACINHATLAAAHQQSLCQNWSTHYTALCFKQRTSHAIKVFTINPALRSLRIPRTSHQMHIYICTYILISYWSYGLKWCHAFAGKLKLDPKLPIFNNNREATCQDSEASNIHQYIAMQRISCTF